LGLEGVQGILYEKIEGRAMIIDDIPTIILGGMMATRSKVRHELYHIHKGHRNDLSTNKWINRLTYWTIKEPQACLYEITGIQL